MFRRDSNSYFRLQARTSQLKIVTEIIPYIKEFLTCSAAYADPSWYDNRRTLLK